MPDEAEVLGLLALLLLIEARRSARTSADGELVLLADQDRAKWDRDQVLRIARAAIRGKGWLGAWDTWHGRCCEPQPPGHGSLLNCESNRNGALLNCVDRRGPRARLLRAAGSVCSSYANTA
jgi:hypothetical protein